jgi:hypothetical protein
MKHRLLVRISPPPILVWTCQKKKKKKKSEALINLCSIYSIFYHYLIIVFSNLIELKDVPTTRDIMNGRWILEAIVFFSCQHHRFYS